MKTIELKEALKVKFPIEEWVFLYEVKTISGRRERYADAVAMNMWPSRGLDVIGFELKTYRSDWLNELRKPEKSDSLIKYCDFFYLVIGDENIVKDEELPDNWGLIIPWRKTKLKIKKKAPRLKSQQLDKEFIASMLRRARDHISEEGVINERVRIEVNKQLEYQSKLWNKDYELLRLEHNELKEKINEFRKKTNIDINIYDNNLNRYFELIDFINRGSINGLVNQIKKIKNSLDVINNQIDSVIIEQEKYEIKRFPRPI